MGKTNKFQWLTFAAAMVWWCCIQGLILRLAMALECGMEPGNVSGYQKKKKKIQFLGSRIQPNGWTDFQSVNSSFQGAPKFSLPHSILHTVKLVSPTENWMVSHIGKPIR